MGASNELPESEELEALYDRFLLRRMVAPVSDVSILDMIQQTQELGDAATDVQVSLCVGLTSYNQIILYY